ncbi:uncharacterized protein LOC142231417 [Haematobia irritans]|uniref:uncharacterized protein LOC142231417 n=1 Tax=Haematobia irritans TaxID=7368 RepID=UPI003F4FDC8D
MPSETGNHQAVGGQFVASLNPINLKAANMAKEWKRWSTQFKIFLRASNLESETDQRKVALLLHHIGSQTMDIFKSFDVNEDTVKYDDLVKMLETHFVPQINIVMERHKFFTCKQEETQSIDEYITLLRNLSSNCDFGVLRDALVRDIFICGLSVSYTNIKERLLSEGDIKLEKAIVIAKNIAMAKQNALVLHSGNAEENTINVVQKGYVKSQIRTQDTRFNQK